MQTINNNSEGTRYRFSLYELSLAGQLAGSYGWNPKEHSDPAEDAEVVIDRAASVLAAQGIDVLDVRRAQPRMEEAFISLIRQQRAGDEA